MTYPPTYQTVQRGWTYECSPRDCCRMLCRCAHLPHGSQADGAHGDDLVPLVADLHHHLLAHVLHAHLQLTAVDAVAQSVDRRVGGIPTCTHLTLATQSRHQNQVPIYSDLEDQTSTNFYQFMLLSCTGMQSKVSSLVIMCRQSHNLHTFHSSHFMSLWILVTSKCGVC